MGPTASGKTDLAVHLVEQLPCDIVSVDSAMVYRGMDIGTAKPDAQLLARAPHRLIDIRDPAEPYSAAAFREDAQREIATIRSRGRIPLLAGGTMLYFSALEHGLSPLPQADPQLRAQLTASAERLGWPAMHKRLAGIDLDAARRIHPNDGQRIQRALEVFALTGRTASDWYAQSERTQPPWPVIKLGIAPPDRQLLHARIKQRFEAMLAAGFLAEVEQMHGRDGLTPDLPSIRAVGYRQLWRHLDGDWSLEVAVERGIIATRQLAKRQFTWLRREASVNWLDSTDPRRYVQAVRILNDSLNGHTAVV